MVDAGAIADTFRVTRQTVHDWRRRREIPFVRVGRTVRFDLDEVLRALRVDAAPANIKPGGAA